MARESREDRFWKKVEAGDGCWKWLAAADPFGYGILGWTKGKERAHRVSYELHYGEIPKGFCVLHKCDTPECTNPEHLFLGTRADNNVDRSLKGRTSRVSRNAGTSQWRSKLTEEIVASIRKARAKGVSLKELSAMYDVGISAISSAARGKTWQHVGGE